MTLNYNRKQPPFYTGGLSNVMQPGNNLGNVFYVQQFTGADTNTGLRPDIPFETVTAALAECNDDMDDTIVVLDYWNADTGNFPIVVNKVGVTIVGAKGGSFSSYVAMTPVGANAIFDIQAGNVRIMDLHFSAEATQAAITFTGGSQRVGIYGCCFAAGTYGIEMTNNNPGAWVEIGNCSFDATLTSGGILVANQAYIRIHDCVFDRVAGIAIEVGGAGGAQIFDNRISLDVGNVIGEGITLQTATHCMIDGNSAGYGEGQGAHSNPYLDNTVVDTNFWGLNYWSGILQAP